MHLGEYCGRDSETYSGVDRAIESCQYEQTAYYYHDHLLLVWSAL